ncbi:MAG: aliphatic sulfonate ABC transporter substrate-binding protein [Comamonas sp.]
MPTSHPTRRRAATSLFAGTLALAMPLAGRAQPAKTLRIGYQKSSTLITILKAQRTLEEQLAPRGVQVSWHEFTSGQPLLEALNTGNVDLSADVADTVPLFAQAVGAELTYYARESPAPAAQAIVVREDSPIRTAADLKGKKIGFAKAAGAHYLVLAVLERAGLKLSDIQPAYLTPADGRAAFDRGAIDAWAIWDPFYAAVQLQDKVRVLADGSGGLASYARYYLAASRYAQANPETVRTVFEALRAAGTWAKRDPAAAAALLAPIWGIDRAIIETANARRSYDIQPVRADNLADQQRIADAFFAEKLLPRKVIAADARIWTPPGS